MRKFTAMILSTLALATVAIAATTYTTNYNLAKPSDGSTTWGSDIRNNLDLIDTQLFSNSGTIQTHIDDTTGAHLATAISTTSGTLCSTAMTVQAYLACLDAQFFSVIGGNVVTLSGTQTITGQKTFTSQIIATGGVLGSLAGNASTATLLNAPRLINGVAFDGGADITITSAAGTLTGSTLNSGVTASSLTSVGTLGTLTVTAPISGSVTGSSGSSSGNAATATALQTARAINGTNFDGTAPITITSAAGTLTGSTLNSSVTASSLTSVGTLGSLTVTNPITGSVTGNAVTATALQTARAINGTNFDGTSAITVTAAAGTLTGSTLNSGVTASSLTSVGTLTSATVSGALTSDGSFVMSQQTDSSSTGANVELTVTKPTTIVTNASLTSIGSVASPMAGKTMTIINRTGTTVSVVNEYTSATAANRIVTGTNANLSLSADSTIILQYSGNDSRWHITGGSGSSSSNDNKLTNAGFESLTTGWTSSGGSFTTTTTAASVFEGTNAGVWDSSSAAQTLTGTAITAGGLAGTNAELTCRIQVPSGTATHTLGVWDGTTLSSSQTITSSSTYTATTINFIVPSSGTITARLTSVNANEVSINVDDCYVGRARNIGTVSQASVLGSVKFPSTTSCSWSKATTANTFGAFTADSDCTLPVGSNITGSASAPATKIPAITFASMGAGEYVVHATGAFFGANANRSLWSFSDGTTTYQAGAIGVSSTATDLWASQITARFAYTSPQSNITLSIQPAGLDTTSTAQIQNDTAGKDLNIWVEYFPSGSQQAINSNATPASWSGYHNGISSGCGTTSATYADTTACTGITLNQITNRNFGTVTTAASSLPGITFNPPRIGTYQVCAYVSQNDTASSNPGARLVDGSGTIINPGVANLNGASAIIVPVCGKYLASSTSATTIKVQLATNVGTTLINTASQPSGTAQIQWTITQEDAAMPTPILVGSVTSNSLGAERIERAVITNNGTCAISSQSGSWMTSATFSSTGLCNLVWPSSTWSAAPTCSCTATQTGGSGVHCSWNSGLPTTTGVSTWTVNGANGLVNTSVSLICQGPR